MKINMGFPSEFFDGDEDTLYKKEHSGLYKFRMVKDVFSRIDSGFTEKDYTVLLEVIATDNYCIQRAHSKTYHVIRYYKNNAWTPWNYIKHVSKLDNRVNLTMGYTLDELKDILKDYIETKKGAAQPLEGRQTIFEPRELEREIDNLVETSKKSKLIPIQGKTIQTRDEYKVSGGGWLNLNGMNLTGTRGIYVNRGIVAYTFTRNPEDLYKVISDNSKGTVIGDTRFNNVIFDGSYRPFIQASSSSEAGRPRRRSANVMLLQDLDWKVAYNGPRTAYVVSDLSVQGATFSEIYYKCTPDLGVNWPQNGTTGPNSSGWRGRTSFVETTDPSENTYRLEVKGVNPNIELVLWR